MNRITIYTIVTGDYDDLRPPVHVAPGCRYVCFTDRERPECAPWEMKPLPVPFANPRRNSRIPKILSHLFHSVDTEYTIYQDADCSMVCDPHEFVAEFLREHDIAVYKHAARNNVWQERDECTCLKNGPYGRRVDPGLTMDAQVERYRVAGLGEGLWNGGVILRRHTRAVECFNEAWWSEYVRGCARDQIAMPYAKWISATPFTVIPGNITKDPKRFRFHAHRPLSPAAPRELAFGGLVLPLTGRLAESLAEGVAQGL